MKAETYHLINENVKNNAVLRIRALPADSTVEIVIQDARSKRKRQRGLQWRWYTDIAKSGMGGRHEDTKDGVHLVCKQRFAIPILLRDDPFFGEIYGIWKENWEGDPERMRWFVEHQVSTERFNVNQMADYLTDLQDHYLSHGFPLSDPDDYKLLKAA